MKIGILQCDDVRPQMQVTHGNYTDMFITLFSRIDATLKFEIWRCHESQLPGSINDADAWLITGSKYGVNDGYDWIESLSAFVQTLHANKRPLTGVCFGHQLLAHALGGKVRKHPDGWGVGVSVNRITKHQPWMNPPQDHLNILVSHQDQVFNIPAEAQILATSDFCPMYMVQYGESTVGVQGHPEFTKQFAADLLESRRNIIDKTVVDAAMESFNNNLDDQLLAKWLLEFMASNVSNNNTQA